MWLIVDFRSSKSEL